MPVTYLKRGKPEGDRAAENAEVRKVVETTLAAIETGGDAAVRSLSERFDNLSRPSYRLSNSEIDSAISRVSARDMKDIQFAQTQIRRFAEAQLATILPLDVEPLPGVFMGHRVIPIERVGCYVPGGRFPLLSAPIMTIVPAKVAGVDEVIACLPPNAHEAMVAGCHLSGADRIFRIGGAQAIAAMAYGTETVPAVNKIMGPGNAFVNEAKRQVFGPVGIDQLAGPSEIYILADETGDAEMIATDLLAQAEHDVRTRVGLITTSRKLPPGTPQPKDAKAAVAALGGRVVRAREHAQGPARDGHLRHLHRLVVVLRALHRSEQYRGARLRRRASTLVAGGSIYRRH